MGCEVEWCDLGKFCGVFDKAHWVAKVRISFGMGKHWGGKKGGEGVGMGEKGQKIVFQCGGKGKGRRLLRENRKTREGRGKEEERRRRQRGENLAGKPQDTGRGRMREEESCEETAGRWKVSCSPRW